MITDVRWFTSRSGCIGIVQIVQDHEKEEYRQTGQATFKYYIATVPGQDERADTESVADFGAPFDTPAGNALFNVL